MEATIYSASMARSKSQALPAAAGSCWCQARLVVLGLPNGVWYVRLKASSAAGSSSRVARFLIAR